MRHLDYAERLEVEEALAVAFGPLRAARADLSPLRVRAAVRWGRGEAPRPLRWTRALSRLSEMGAAAGVAGMIFVAALGDPAAGGVATSRGMSMLDPGFRDPPAVKSLADDPTWLRWLRLDRYVPVQDWLDPAVTRLAGPRAAPLPAPRDGGRPAGSGPF